VAPFGDRAFMNVLAARFDVLCHHAARVLITAAQTLTSRRHFRKYPQSSASTPHDGGNGLRALFLQVASSRKVRVPVSRRYVHSRVWCFESAHCGDRALLCQSIAVPLGKFVIPNPFGPLEEPRFAATLSALGAKAKSLELRHRVTYGTTFTSPY